MDLFFVSHFVDSWFMLHTRCVVCCSIQLLLVHDLYFFVLLLASLPIWNLHVAYVIQIFYMWILLAGFNLSGS